MVELTVITTDKLVDGSARQFMLGQFMLGFQPEMHTISIGPACGFPFVVGQVLDILMQIQGV